MSGNFTQRGEPAIICKHSRARQAVAAGAELVFELPVCYALGPAEVFADAATAILEATGTVDTLSFGSECGDVELLTSAALTLGSEEAFEKGLESGLSYPQARSAALPSELAEVLSTPNNLLGAEYIRALRSHGSDMEVFTVKRRGSGHDEPGLSGFSSASAIRSAVLSSDTLPSEALPEFTRLEMSAEAAAGRFPVDPDALELSILARLRTVSPSELAEVAEVSEGLENRIASCARSACDLEGFINAVKTRRYTRARIGRIAMQAVLGITKELQHTPVPYLRLLAASDSGRTLLNEISQSSSLPLITKPAAVKSLSPAAVAVANAEARADDIYSLLYPSVSQRTGGSFYTVSPSIR